MERYDLVLVQRIMLSLVFGSVQTSIYFVPWISHLYSTHRAYMLKVPRQSCKGRVLPQSFSAPARVLGEGSGVVMRWANRALGGIYYVRLYLKFEPVSLPFPSLKVKYLSFDPFRRYSPYGLML